MRQTMNLHGSDSLFSVSVSQEADDELDSATTNTKKH